MCIKSVTVKPSDYSHYGNESRKLDSIAVP